MKTYKIYLDKIVNELTPSFLRGRSHILWIQSMLSPLKDISKSFAIYTKEKILEATVNCTVMHFEWYLNHKFSDYYVDENASIKLIHFEESGNVLYNPGETGEVPNVVWGTNEDWSSAIAEEQPQLLYFKLEILGLLPASFKVSVPELKSSIAPTNFNVMLRAEVERYRLAGKTYIIENS